MVIQAITGKNRIGTVSPGNNSGDGVNSGIVNVFVFVNMVKVIIGALPFAQSSTNAAVCYTNSSNQGATYFL